MKLRCTTKVCIRPTVQSNLSIRNSAPATKFVQSSLALCKHPNKPDEHCLILFTLQNKNGTKYLLKDNVQQVLTKFIHEGKATIQLRSPTVDLFVASDVTPLKSFLHILKRVLCGQILDKELSLSSLSVSEAKLTAVCRKMIVLKRSEYPTKGFPRTLEHLVINDIGLHNVNCGILKLAKLRILDLSNNCISEIPKDMSRMNSLIELHLSSNSLGDKKCVQNWDWICGNLTSSLNTLNLKGNRLTFIPKQIARLKKLITLNLDDNNVSTFPSALCRLQSLETLTMANNNLDMLPMHIKRLNLKSLDISCNNFPLEPVKNCHITPKVWPIKSLKDACAIAVLSEKINYTEETIPMELCRFLCDASYCYCCRPIFNVAKQFIVSDESKSLARNVSHSNYMVLLEVYFCSLKCYNWFQKKRTGVQR